MSLSLVVLLLLKASSALVDTATAAARAVQLVSEIASTHPSAAVIALTERPGAVSVATDVARLCRIAVFTNAIAIVRRLAAGVRVRVYFPEFLFLGLGASPGILGGGFLVAGVMGYAGVLCVDGVLVVASLLGVIGLDSRTHAIVSRARDSDHS